MSAAHVHADDLGVKIGARMIFDGVGLLAQRGVTVLLGPNGAGKTTLLRCLATAIRPTTGSVRVDGLDPDSERERIEIRRRLGYQPQALAARDAVRVFDAIDHVAVLREHHDAMRRRRLVADALFEVGLADRVRDRVRDLSGGMRQRLGLAMAILGDPSLLVLDEPASGLDPDERRRMGQIIDERRDDATILVSTHLTDEAADADAVAVLHEGRIVFHDTPTRLAVVADGRAWVQAGPPLAGTVRSVRRQPDGRHRCLGLPPPDAELVPPSLEDGYLLLTG
ncbi:MAG: ABC transporter ATP-binding protein [Actinomycetota bacterium]